MFAVLTAVAMTGLAQPEPPAVTADDVARQLRRLTTDADEKERISAAFWFSRNAKAKPVLAAVPDLEKVVRQADFPFQPRVWTLVAVAEIAKAHGQPVPKIAFEMLYESEVGPFVGSQVFAKFKPLPADATKELIKYATSDRPTRRYDGLFLLAEYAPKDAAALKVIRAAHDDPDARVRHAARVALFNATGDLDEFFPYVLRYLLETSELADLPPGETEAEKEARIERNLTTIWLATRLAEWTEERPTDVRDQLVKALAHKDPLVRRAAAGKVGRFAEWLRTPPEPVEFLRPAAAAANRQEV